MNREAAEALAQRIAKTPGWDAGSLADWVDALMTVDEGVAGTTYIRLRNTREKCPTIAGFLAEAKANSPHGHAVGPMCHACNRTGFIGASQTIDGKRVTCVLPCPYCEAGEQAGKVLRRINDERRTFTHETDHSVSAVVPDDPDGPRPGPHVSLSAHLAHLRRLAFYGDPEATDELATWERHIGRSSVWAKALELVADTPDDDGTF